MYNDYNISDCCYNYTGYRGYLREKVRNISDEKRRF